MKLTMLGTGNAGVTDCYNTCFILSEEDRLLMVDGGGGNAILKQIKNAGFDWKNIHDIIVTHDHIDHLLGILWMMRMICQGASRGEYNGEARIYAHDQVINAIRTLAALLLGEKQTRVIGEKLHLIEVKDKETVEIIGCPVTFFDIGSTKTKQFGFMMEYEKGNRLVCCGDEPFYESETEYAAGCKWLLHEAFCLYTERERFQPYKKHHSTVKDACESAEKLGVENLVLYHTEDNEIADRKKRYYEEGIQYYHGNLFIPDDLESLEL